MEINMSTEGRTCWNWVFQNAEVVIHVIRPSRAGGVVEQVLDGHRPQIWVSDCKGRMKFGPSAFPVQRVSFAGGSDRDGITPLRGRDGATGQIRHGHTSCA
jgi:hypothetical protein